MLALVTGVVGPRGEVQSREPSLAVGLVTVTFTICSEELWYQDLDKYLNQFIGK